MSEDRVRASVLEVNRANPFEQTRIVDQELAAGSEDSVLLAVERFSLATNNLGYVVLADFLRSWDAFPSPTPGWGRVPAWGMARVVSASETVAAVGSTFTGYVPMATHVAVQARPVDDDLLAMDEPRSLMLPIYRRLISVTAELGWGEHEIDIDTVMLPVFPFAALLAHDLTRDGARSVVISSASSRSAAALSRVLGNHGVEVIGLTSDRNRSAVESFGVYTHVLTYNDIADLPNLTDVVYVDLAGNGELRAAVHQQLGNKLVASIAAGGTHLRSLPAPTESGPEVTLFNTGDREEQMTLTQGREVVEAIYSDARTELVSWAGGWLRITRLRGLVAAEETWRNIAAGQSDPLSAVVIQP